MNKMRIYYPDKFSILAIHAEIRGFPPMHHRVLGGWSGGFITPDEFRLNSGIIGVERLDDSTLAFTGTSGSTYVVAQSSYGMMPIMISGRIRAEASPNVSKVKVLGDQDWMNFFSKQDLSWGRNKGRDN